MANLWKVVSGISAWRDKVGKLIKIEGEWIVLRIKEVERDEEFFYDVRMPLNCCKEVIYEKAKK